MYLEFSFFLFGLTTKFLIECDSFNPPLVKNFSCQNPAENENMKIQCHLNDNSYAQFGNDTDTNRHNTDMRAIIFN